VLIYHKPQGQPLAEEEGGTIESVMSRLPAERGVRWIPINPMHPGDSGLLLLTNDGALSYALTRHKRAIPAAYAVRVLQGAEEEEGIREVPTSVSYDNETVEFSKVEAAGGEGSNVWYRVEIPRADHRAAVRALFESQQFKVSRMTQVSFGSIALPRDLPRGRHREVSKEQLTELYRLAELTPPYSEGAADRSERKKPVRRIAPDRRVSTRKRSQRR
jgi:pseudouridine synthase